MITLRNPDPIYYFGHDYAINSIAQLILFQLYFFARRPNSVFLNFWARNVEMAMFQNSLLFCITRIFCVNLHVIPAVPCWYFMFLLAADRMIMYLNIHRMPQIQHNVNPAFEQIVVKWLTQSKFLFIPIHFILTIQLIEGSHLL